MATTTSADQLLPMITSHNRLDVIKFVQKISYDKFSTRPTVNVDSNNFKPPGKCGPEYFLRFHPYSSSMVYLHLHLVASKPNTRIAGTTSVLDRDGSKIFPYNFNTLIINQGGNCYIFDKTHAEVNDATKGLLPNDILTFYCEFTFTVESNVDRIALVSDQLMEKFEQNSRINDDFGRLLTDGKLTDVQLVVGGKQFLAHKCILAARSPVFGAMFEHDTKEKQDNRVEITDVDSDVFAEVLRYIYTGKIGSLDKYGAELLVVADKYQLDSLKALCEDILCDKLNPQKVTDLIVLADQHSAQKLKQNALEYFRKHTQESIESMFETNKSEALVKAFRDLTSSGK